MVVELKMVEEERGSRICVADAVINILINLVIIRSIPSIRRHRGRNLTPIAYTRRERRAGDMRGLVVVIVDGVDVDVDVDEVGVGVGVGGVSILEGLLLTHFTTDVRAFNNWP